MQSALHATSALHAKPVPTFREPWRLENHGFFSVLLDAVSEFQMVVPDQLPQLYERLLRDITQVILPPRRNRINPRVVRRRQVKFHCKQPWHYHWPQPTQAFREAIALI